VLSTRGLPSPVDCAGTRRAPTVRLVAFPHAGGGPSTFARWPALLRDDVELWRVTLPGRAWRRREPFERSWPTLTDTLGSAIASEVPGPIVLIGHSLGGLLAFETARWLTAARLAPARLIVCGCPAPENGVVVPVPDGDSALIRAASRLGRAVPDAVLESAEAVALFAPILRADLELARAYVLHPGPSLGCPITAAAGDRDPLAPPSSLGGWSRHTRARCELRVLPGGHFCLHDHAGPALASLGYGRSCMQPLPMSSPN
jgi:surfactin synthase thioesterase subunit